MDDPIVISLVVSGIGMLMLFLALGLLYGLMVLMTRMTDIRRMTDMRGLIGERPEAETGGQGARSRKQEAEGKKQEARAGKRRAAVIGVALARAELELSQASAPGTDGAASSGRVSPWRALHHQRQLTLSLRARRTR